MAEVATATTTAATSATAPSQTAPAQPPASAPAKGDGKTATQAQTPGKGATGASGAAPVQAPSAPAPGADAAKQASQPAEVKPEPTKPAAPEKDEVAETMARLNREQREMAAAKKKLEASQREMGDKVKLGEALVAAREALGKKDFLGALTTLAGEAGLDPDEAAVLLFEQASKRDKEPLTEEQARKVAAEEFEAKQKAAKEEAEKREAAEIEQGKQLYGNACAEIYKANASQFPLIAAYGLTDAQIFDWVIPEMKRNRGNPPLPQQTLEHFEKQHLATFERAAKALGWVKAQPVPAEQATAAPAGKQPAAVTATAPVADTAGDVVTPKQKRETVKEYDARIKAQFAARRQPRA